MAGAQEMGRISERLRREQCQSLGSDLDDVPTLEGADRHVIAGELAVGRVICSEWEELMVRGVAHCLLRYAILLHKSRLRACVKSAPDKPSIYTTYSRIYELPLAASAGKSAANLPFIVELGLPASASFMPQVCNMNGALSRSSRLALIGEGDELGFARHRRKAALAPIGFGLFDAIGRAGDEVPPEVPHAVERRAAQQQHPSGAGGGQVDRFAAPQNQHPALLEAVAADLDAPLGDVDRSLLVLGRDLQPGARGEHRIGIKGLREQGQRRARAVKRPGDDARPPALPVEHWQRVLRMMRERRLGFFIAFRQTDP